MEPESAKHEMWVADRVPLLVDFDSMVLRTDLLVELIFRLLTAAPLSILKLFAWVVRGKAVLKRQLIQHMDLAPDRLTVDKALLNFLETEHIKGRPIYLVSTSEQHNVKRLGASFGFVDGVFAPDEAGNVTPDDIPKRIVDEFGTGGFDYTTNEAPDLNVWRVARNVVVVDAPKKVERQIRQERPDAVILHSHVPRYRVYLHALRPHQWLKNVLVFVPLVAAHRTDVGAIGAAGVAFLAFSFCASGVYVLNDLFDLPNDRRHPRKRIRPFASGAIPLTHGLMIIPVLLVVAAMLAAAVSFEFLGTLVCYFAVTTLYSAYLKRKLLIDVLTLGGLYTVRVFAGAVAISVPVSPWLLGFSLFMFLSLAIVKRYTELIGLREHKGDPVGRGYRFEDLSMLASMGAASGFGAVLVLALYINSPNVRVLYSSPELLWMVCPVLMYWIGRMLMLSHRGQIHDDPVVFAVGDRISWLVGGLVIAVGVAAV